MIPSSPDPEAQDPNTDTPHPLEVMRNAYQRMEIDFEVDDDGARLVRRSSGKGAALVAQMRGRRLRMSTDEILALTRGDA